MTLQDDIIKQVKDLKLTKAALASVSNVIAEQKRRDVYKELGLEMSTSPRWIPVPVPQDHLRDIAGEREDQEI